MASARSPPWGLKFRSSTSYILTTISIAMFTDLFLYGLIVPILPFILSSRLSLPHSAIQSSTSLLLACYAFASVLFSLPAGLLADRLPSRQLPFLGGLAALLGATCLLWLGQTYALLITARVLQGASAAVVWTVGLALIMDTVGSDNLGTAIGSIFGIISVGELLAPVLGGVIYQKAGQAAVFGMGFAIIGVDFVMRLFVIEKKVAARYGLEESSSSSSSASNEDEEGQSQENTPLLSNPSKPSSAPEELEKWKIPDNLPKLCYKFPILYPLSHSRLLTALLEIFTQATLLGVFDATIPTTAMDLFNFDSLSAGLLFIPLVLPSLVLGPLCGRFVDRAGPKTAATMGFLLLIPALICLRIPHSVPAGQDPKFEIIKFAGIIASCSIGLSFINSPGLLEASYVIEQYQLANPDHFGSEGPYAQLYAVNNVCFCSGLTVGPLVAGALRNSIGYGDMNLVVAGLCAVLAVLCFCFLGGPRPRWEHIRARVANSSQLLDSSP